MASIRVGRLGTQLWCLSKIIIVFPYQIPLGGKLHWQAPECVFKCVLEVSCYPGSWHWAVMSITGYGHSTNRPGHHGTVVARTVGGVATLWYSNASCHPHSLENATHLAGTGVQVLIYMGQMQPGSSSVGWSVDARCDSHTDFHLQQKIEYKSGFHGNGYTKVVYLV